MRIKIAWAIQSFFLCFLFNLALAALLFFMADRVLEAVREWVLPVVGPGGPDLPEDVHMGLVNLGNLVAQERGQLKEVLGALVSAFTLLMWCLVFLAGRRQIRKAAKLAESRREPVSRRHDSALPEASEGRNEQSEEGEEAR
jgi:hypothetical protein